MSADDYVIREARADEEPLLMNFLELHFFPREYLLATYIKRNRNRIKTAERTVIMKNMRDMHTVMITYLPCLVAIHKQTNKIAGMNLMLVNENPAYTDRIVSQDEIMSLVPAPTSKYLSRWFKYVLDPSDESVDFFETFPLLRSSLKLIIVCVDPAHGGHGLATKLISEAVNYARSKQIGLVHGLFTSAISRRAAEKNGFVSFRDVDIVNLRDPRGRLMYAGHEPYVISVMAKELMHES